LERLVSINGLPCSPVPIAGLYEGNFYFDAPARITPGFVVIAPNEEFSVLIFDSLVGRGKWSASGKDFSASATVLGTEAGKISDSVNLSLSGTFSAGYRMVGDFQAGESDGGTFDFFALPALYHRALSLAEIAGTYRVKTLVTGAEGSLTLSQAGTLSGSDSYGCDYAGEISLPDPQFNLLEFSIAVTGCGSWNGTYRGYGAQIDDQELDDNRVIRLMGRHERFPAIIDLMR
jgi:hypothetical protein